MPAAYFRGLNFLLSEQPDRAIDAFIDVVRFDPETVELHFALGKLFRQRGENDRAIRVHQNLLERVGIDPLVREQALFELGLDFLKAGLLDRAEQAFLKLEGTGRAAAALRHRLDIAQLVRDWPLAIELASRLPAADPSADEDHALIHFHCELAAKALGGDSTARFDEASRHLDRAKAIAPTHPRVALMEGDIAMACGRPEQAIAAWELLRREQPGWFVLGARSWLAAHQATGRGDEAIALLESQIEVQRSPDLLLIVLDARMARDGRPAAVAWAKEAIRRVPSLIGLDRLLELELAEAQPVAGRAELELTRALLRPQTQRQSRYVCTHCGFRARQYSWQCPGCSRWESCAPQRAEELESA
jgi:lipopolysaccharide biosynthesis regulator YciM